MTDATVVAAGGSAAGIRRRENMFHMGEAAQCDLCDAARLTEWYFEDDVCWIAECEACFVPMVVWKRHDPNPPEEVRVELHQRLKEIAGPLLASEYWIDDRLRSIPDHYHAHARRRPTMS